eukprot:2694596-Rhodomonas_salina.1
MRSGAGGGRRGSEESCSCCRTNLRCQEDAELGRRRSLECGLRSEKGGGRRAREAWDSEGGGRGRSAKGGGRRGKSQEVPGDRAEPGNLQLRFAAAEPQARVVLVLLLVLVVGIPTVIFRGCHDRSLSQSVRVPYLGCHSGFLTLGPVMEPNVVERPGPGLIFLYGCDSDAPLSST